MSRMRFRKMYPQDLKGNLLQQDMNRYIRPGIIEDVDVFNGLCTIRWMDRPGTRVDVPITQGSPREWVMPLRGDSVLCSVDSAEQVRILRYMNQGQPVRMFEVSLPRLRPGERLWEAGQSYIYMKTSGDIEVMSISHGQLLLGNLSRTFGVNVGNFQVKTDGGKLFFGQVKRMVPDPLSGGMVQRVVQDLTLQDLNEMTLNVYEHAPSPTDMVVSPTPIMSMTLGTLVGPIDPTIPLDPTAGKTLAWSKPAGVYIPAPIPTKEVMCRIKLKSGVQIDIDKSGSLSIQGVKLNINQGQVDTTDPDVALGLEVPSIQGTHGQHVAREHDTVTIPLGSGFTDPAHIGLATQASLNATALQTFITSSFVAGANPITLSPGAAAAQAKLEGEITSGSKNVYVGDK
jgi:hypothetical protein